MNNVRKKALSCLLCLAMLLSLVPAMSLTAQAATTWSSNQTLSSSKTFNDEIIITQSITLNLNGYDANAKAGIYVQSGTLTITGGGKLYVDGNRSSTNTMGHGIKGNVVVNNAGLNVNAADRGYGIQGDLEVIGGDASVNVYGGYGGEPQKSGVGSNGGRGISGNVTVNGGSLYVEGGSGGDGAYGEGSKKGGSGSAGIGGNVAIRNGGYVHAVGGSGGDGTGDYGKGGIGQYGINGSLTATSGSAMVIGGDGGNGYDPSAACYGTITAGFRKESSTGGRWTDISGDTSSLQYVKVEGHAHHYSYTASGATITATCDAEECSLTGRTASLTLKAPTGVLMEDGSTKAATISGEIPQVATPGIAYTKDGVAVDASQVKNAGNYVASITLGDAVASVEFTINPPSYIITIPAKLDVNGSGYHATKGITASGTINSDQTVVVSASSANGWKLKYGNNSIPYYLTTAEGGAKTTQWTFYEDELAETTTKPLGAVVDEFDDRIPSGNYADTVTFSTRLGSIYTTRQVWTANELYNAANGGAATITKDGFTLKCGGLTRASNGTVVISGGGTFSYDRGTITRIEIYADTKNSALPDILYSNGWVLTNYRDTNVWHYVWIAWSGTPARTVSFNGGMPMDNSDDYTIKITTIDDR